MDDGIDLWGDRSLRAHESLLTQALGRAGTEPDWSARTLADAAIAASIAGEFETASATAALAQRIARRADRATRAIVAINHALVEFSANRSAPSVDVAAAIRKLGPIKSEAVAESVRESAVILLWAEEYASSASLLHQIVALARERSWSLLPLALDTLASVEFRTGRWVAADAHSAEAIRLADAGNRQPFVLASALTTLARIEGARGREVECRGLLVRARELNSPGGLAAAYAASAAGLLELSVDQPAAAIAELEPLFRGGRGAYGPTVVPSAPDLIEAYVRSHRPADATAALVEFETQAVVVRRGWVLAAAARCRGMLALSATFDAEFREALALHATTTTPFERARTELCYGERLRRARRTDEAIAHLSAACLTFDALGASTWARRARRELAPKRSTGSTRSAPATMLTTHELQVSGLVRSGATNREIAEALFVSEKTVEYHLANAYRKLDVRSRTELALLLERAERTAR